MEDPEYGPRNPTMQVSTQKTDPLASTPQRDKDHDPVIKRPRTHTQNSFSDQQTSQTQR